MKSTSIKLLAGVALALTPLLGSAAGTSAATSEVLVTHKVMKSGSEVSIELNNTAGVSAMDFIVSGSPEAIKAIDASTCMSGLPSSHRGACRVVNGQLKVIIYSPTNEPLSTGIVSSLRLNTTQNVQLSVSNVNMFSADGSAVKADVLSDIDISNEPHLRSKK